MTDLSELATAIESVSDMKWELGQLTDALNRHAEALEDYNASIERKRQEEINRARWNAYV